MDAKQIPFLHFYSSGRAYDFCNTSEAAENGTVIVVENEAVVGIVETWPIAVTKEVGVLHFLEPRANKAPYDIEWMTYKILWGLVQATSLAVQLEFPLNAHSKEWFYISKARG